METEASASVPQGEQCHMALFVMDATRELPGTTNHQLPPSRGKLNEGLIQRARGHPLVDGKPGRDEAIQNGDVAAEGFLL